jgi:DNA-binding NarL/FixJ family response regulator
VETVRVLIADDHAEFRATIRSLLVSLPGIEVVGEAGDGEQAIRQAREIEPDLVLMDIKMPYMNGLSATRKLKREMPALKVIIITLYGDHEYREAAQDSGADGFLTKDLVGWELAPAIWRVVNNQPWKGSFASVSC